MNFHLTSAQMAFVIGILAVCSIALAWLVVDSRRGTGRPVAGKTDDREQMLEMLAKVEDNLSLTAYKKAYRIRDEEIIAKKKTFNP